MAVAVSHSITPLLENNPPAVEIWAHNESKKHKINFNWTINNFSFRQKRIGNIIKSPVFSADTNDKIKWRLDLQVKSNEETKNHLSIFLHLVPDPRNKLEVIGKLKLSILNVKREKIKESILTEPHHFQPPQGWGFDKFLPLELLEGKHGYLPEDKLTILCEVIYISDSSDNAGISDQKTIGHFKVPESNISEDLGSLLDCSKLSDVTLVVGEHTIQAHKVILAARSEVFAAMFEHDMKESKLGRVIITDIDHEVLKKMLRYIYSGETPKLEEMDERLLAAADKYGLKQLKVMSEEALFAKLTVETAAETLVLADLYNADQLKEQTIHFINANAKEIMKTIGWKNIVNANANSALIVEIFQAFVSHNSESTFTNKSTVNNE